jgi:hypothetical protein
VVSRAIYTSVTGHTVARQIKAEAAETCPDDYQGQQAYMLGVLGAMLAENKAPNGKPWPAPFWRGLGEEINK